jgi:pimeloyl-ACP methyl ester carboxylesterase
MGFCGFIPPDRKTADEAPADRKTKREATVMALAQVNGTELWYSIEGEGEPLMLFPGLGLDHTYYRLGTPLLRDHFQLVLIDPRGIGKSRKDPPTKVTYTPELWADDFAALARYLKFDKVNILGSSLGGSMAMAFAEKYPELTKSLVVIGGFSELDRALETNFRLRKKIVAKLGMGEEIADFMGLSTMTREYMATDAGLAVMRANQTNVRNNSAEFYTAFLDSILWWGRRLPGQEKEPLFTTRLKNIKCPTLVIAGDNDYFIPTFFSKIIADNIEGSEYREIRTGGHIPFIEKPQETAAVVIDFLERHESGLEHFAVGRLCD